MFFISEKLHLPSSLQQYHFLLCTGSESRLEHFRERTDFLVNIADPAMLSGEPEAIEPPLLTSLHKAQKALGSYAPKISRVGLGVDVGVTVNGVELHNLKRNGDAIDWDGAREQALELYCRADSIVVWTIGMTLLTSDDEIANTGGIEIAARYSQLSEELVDSAISKKEQAAKINTRIPLIELAPLYAKWVTAREFFSPGRRRPMSKSLAYQLIVGGLPTQEMLNRLAQNSGTDRFPEGIAIAQLPLRYRE